MRRRQILPDLFEAEGQSLLLNEREFNRLARERRTRQSSQTNNEIEMPTNDGASSSAGSSTSGSSGSSTQQPTTSTTLNSVDAMAEAERKIKSMEAQLKAAQDAFNIQLAQKEADLDG